MKKNLLTLLALLMLALPVSAQELEVTGSRKAVRTSGDIGAVLLPVAGLTAVLVRQDWQGLKQGAFSALATAGITYALKYSVKKDRPDHSDRHSFPSMHTATSFASAAFIQRRYGWKWGLPASMTDGTYLPEPPSAPDARTSSPARLPKSTSWQSIP